MLPVVGEVIDGRDAIAKREVLNEFASPATVADLPNPLTSRWMQ